MVRRRAARDRGGARAGADGTSPAGSTRAAAPADCWRISGRRNRRSRSASMSRPTASLSPGRAACGGWRARRSRSCRSRAGRSISSRRSTFSATAASTCLERWPRRTAVSGRAGFCFSRCPPSILFGASTTRPSGPASDIGRRRSSACSRRRASGCAAASTAIRSCSRRRRSGACSGAARRPGGKRVSDVAPAPRALGSFFAALLGLERRLTGIGFSFPFGLSVFCLAERIETPVPR